MFRRNSAILLFALFTGLIGSLGSAFDAHSQDSGFTLANPPRPVPLFQFKSGKGRNLDLKNFRGRYLLLNLWSTACAPCAAEMPALNALSKKFDSRKLEIIALSEDRDGIDVARLFYSRHGIDHLPVYNDPSGRAPFILHVRGVPTTLFIDPEGQEIARLEGAADWTKESIVSFLEARMRP